VPATGDPAVRGESGDRSFSGWHIDGRVAIKRLLCGHSIAMLHYDAEQRECVEVRVRRVR